MKKDVAAPKNQYTDTFFNWDDDQKESTDALPADAPTESTTPPTPTKKTQQNQSPNSSASNSPEPQHAVFALDEELDKELTLETIPAKKSLAGSAPKQTSSLPITFARNGVNGSSLPGGLPMVTSQSQKIDRAQKSTRSATSAPLDYGVSTPWDDHKVARANGRLKLSQFYEPANKTENDKVAQADDSLKLSQLDAPATKTDHDKDEDVCSSPSL